MKAQANRTDLLEALERARKVAPSSSHNPALECAVIEAAGASVVILATDLETYIRHEVAGAVVQSDGRAVFNARKLAEFLKAAEGSIVELDAAPLAVALSDDPKAPAPQLPPLVVRTSDGEAFELERIDEEDYPTFPAFVADVGARLDAHELARMLRRALPSAAREVGRYAMHCVRLEFNGADRGAQILPPLECVATDGRRLAIATAAGMVERFGVDTLRGLLPLRSAEILGKLLPAKLRKGEEAQRARVVLGRKDESAPLGGDRGPKGPKFNPADEDIREALFAFSWGPVQLLARSVDGEFPRFRAVIPPAADKESKLPRSHVRIPTEEALRRLKVARVATSEEARAVRLRPVDGKGLEISAGTHSSKAAAVVKGATWETHEGADEMGVNPDFLAEALESSECAEMLATWSAKPNPIRLEGCGFVAVVMPITVDG